MSDIAELREAIDEIVAQRDTANELIALIRTVFTREDVDALRSIANDNKGQIALVLTGGAYVYADDVCNSLASRIEALSVVHLRTHVRWLIADAVQNVEDNWDNS